MNILKYRIKKSLKNPTSPPTWYAESGETWDDNKNRTIKYFMAWPSSTNWRWIRKLAKSRQGIGFQLQIEKETFFYPIVQSVRRSKQDEWLPLLFWLPFNDYRHRSSSPWSQRSDTTTTKKRASGDWWLCFLVCDGKNDLTQGAPSTRRDANANDLFMARSQGRMKNQAHVSILFHSSPDLVSCRLRAAQKKQARLINCGSGSALGFFSRVKSFLILRYCSVKSNEKVAMKYLMAK